jgi:predicted membrane-bound dolichyl-phosphate-mannose-protein mannosyltransferase
VTEGPPSQPTGPVVKEPGQPRASALRGMAARLLDNLSDPATALPLLLIGALVVRLIWLELPRGSHIFDEAYYVNAARAILGWAIAPGAHYYDAPAGLDPNTEHPPLGKLLIALSMWVLGDQGIAWRIPSVIAGMTALGAVFLIVRAAGETAWLAILAVGFLAFDNLVFVHGRIGTLDMLVLAPLLVGAWLALRERWALAGLAMGVAILVKLTALYGVLALLLMIGLKLFEEWRVHGTIAPRSLRPVMTMLLTFGAVAIAGLWVLDSQFTTFASPIDHYRRMFEYGANLRGPVVQSGTCPGADSAPTQWLFNQCQITYLKVDVTVRAGADVVSTVPSIDIRGALNPLLVAAIPFAILFAGWYAWATNNLLARWSVVWAAANYLPYLALELFTQRIMYIYYTLQVVPALAVATAILLRRGGLPRAVTWGFVGAYALGFVAYFPFRQIP